MPPPGHNHEGIAINITRGVYRLTFPVPDWKNSLLNNLKAAWAADRQRLIEKIEGLATELGAVNERSTEQDGVIERQADTTRALEDHVEELQHQLDSSVRFPFFVD